MSFLSFSLYLRKPVLVTVNQLALVRGVSKNETIARPSNLSIGIWFSPMPSVGYNVIGSSILRATDFRAWGRALIQHLHAARSVGNRSIAAVLPTCQPGHRTLKTVFLVPLVGKKFFLGFLSPRRYRNPGWRRVFCISLDVCRASTSHTSSFMTTRNSMLMCNLFQAVCS